MSRPLSELEAVLRQLLAEHRRLLEHAERHEAALKTFDLRAIDDAARQQEAARARLVVLEQRRRSMAIQLARSLNLPAADLTIRRLAELHPPRAAALMQLRAELKACIEQIAARARVSGKLAAAVLGHLNTVVRLIAGAIQGGGLYTKQGVPRMSGRIGAVEAVG